MNLLPLCQSRQALQGAAAPARRFERILVRRGVPVNKYDEKNGARAAWVSQIGSEVTKLWRKAPGLP